MKINQVEELVGITKKNIRFYEEQGLICPKRNRDNGYRDYSLEDVELLNKIKLLRRLNVSIEEIRKIETKELSLLSCLDRHISIFEREKRELDILKEMCNKMISEGEDFDNLKADSYLDEMKQLEKGGVRFMDVEKTDIKKAKRAPIIAAAVVAIFFVFLIGVMFWAEMVDPETPIGIVIFTVAIFVAIIVGVIVALIQRLKEIDGGEMNEASKY
ncbi:MAG: MerR family transcriptional regulator [Lachnospiraceae bacterium]|nr:MerR family transcriptional regulator [Lachnospiraceae bacterium]